MKMRNSPDLSFSRTLPISTFNQLRELLQQIPEVEDTTLVITEAVLTRISIPPQYLPQKFIVVVSQGFSALLIGKHDSNNRGVGLIFEDDSPINLSLTFDTNAIASFLLELRDLFKSDSQAYSDLSQYSQIVAPNDAGLQGKFPKRAPRRKAVM